MKNLVDIEKIKSYCDQFDMFIEKEKHNLSKYYIIFVNNSDDFDDVYIHAYSLHQYFKQGLADFYKTIKRNTNTNILLSLYNSITMQRCTIYKNSELGLCRVWPEDEVIPSNDYIMNPYHTKNTVNKKAVKIYLNSDSDPELYSYIYSMTEFYINVWNLYNKYDSYRTKCAEMRAQLDYDIAKVDKEILSSENPSDIVDFYNTLKSAIDNYKNQQ